MLLAPLSVAALRLFEPLDLAASPTPWLPAVAAAVVATLCAAAMLPAVMGGLRTSAPALLLRAGAIGSLAVGLAIAAGRAGSEAAAFPDPAPQTLASMEDVLDWPPNGSALGRPPGSGDSGT